MSIKSISQEKFDKIANCLKADANPLPRLILVAIECDVKPAIVYDVALKIGIYPIPKKIAESMGIIRRSKAKLTPEPNAV